MNIEASIESFLTKACFTDSGFGEGTGGVVLKIQDALGKTDTLREYAVASNTDVGALAKTIYLDAFDEAEGRGTGDHQFAIYAMQQGAKTHFARRSFRMPVENSGDSLQEDTTARGLLGQSQRHLEAAMRIHNASQSVIQHGWGEILRVAIQQNQQYAEIHGENMSLMRDLIQGKEEREADMTLKIRREERYDQILGKLAEMAPVVMDQLLPGGIQGMLQPSEQPTSPTPPAPKVGAPLVPPNGQKKG